MDYMALFISQQPPLPVLRGPAVDWKVKLAEAEECIPRSPHAHYLPTREISFSPITASDFLILLFFSLQVSFLSVLTTQTQHATLVQSKKKNWSDGQR